MHGTILGTVELLRTQLGIATEVPIQGSVATHVGQDFVDAIAEQLRARHIDPSAATQVVISSPADVCHLRAIPRDTESPPARCAVSLRFTNGPRLMIFYQAVDGSTWINTHGPIPRANLRRN